MTAVTIPTRFESNLTLGDGSSGTNLSEVLKLTSNNVPNLYSSSDTQFNYCFQEYGVAYGEKEASVMKAEVSFPLPTDKDSNFSLILSNKPVEKWGINFAGTVHVSHKSGEERVIYLPGTRTYDPAGITGDPHASERIGPSCSRTQLAISVTHLIAAIRGANTEHIALIQEKTRPLILRYHGRENLFDWMAQQINEAIYQNKTVTPYPEFLLKRISTNNLKLGSGQEHTQAYLDSYTAGKPHPPVHYYRKVAVKDSPKDLLSDAELKNFNKIIA